MPDEGLGALVDSPTTEGADVDSPTTENISEAQDPVSQDAKTDSEVEKPTPFHEHPDWKAMIQERNNLRQQLEDLQKTSTSEEKKTPELSPDGQKYTEAITDKVADDVWNRIQKKAEEAAKSRQEADQRSEQIINDLRTELGDDFTSFQTYAKEQVERFPSLANASIDELKSNWQKDKGATRETVSNPTKPGGSTVQKVIASRPGEDFGRLAERAKGLL